MTRSNPLKHPLFIGLALFTAIFMALLIPALTPGQGADPLTPSQREWLAARNNTLRLAPCPDWEPMEFFDAKGNYQGMVADHIRLIEQKLNIRFKRVRYPSWTAILDAAARGEVDVIPAAHPTPERWAFMDWTDPYLEFPSVIITHRDDSRDLTPADMAGMNVGVCKDYVVVDYLQTNFPRLNLSPLPSGRQGLNKVSFRELDAMIMELPAAFYTIEQQKITNLRMAGNSHWVARYAIGTSKAQPRLHAIMQKGLDMITPAEKRRIQKRWIGLEQSLILHQKFFIYLGMGLAALLTLVVVTVFTWNRTLKGRVESAVQELNEELEEKSRAQEQNRKLEAQLRQAHKMEAIGTLAGGIAHDFNNILGTIIGYGEMMEIFDLPEKGQARDRLDQILAASYRARDLVDQILTFSRQSDAETRPVGLAPVIKETAKFIQVLLPPNVEMKILPMPPDLSIEANPVQIHQLLMNLCTNAAHAIGEENQGRITLELDRREIRSHALEDLPPGPYARLTIIDTGGGIPPEALDRVFDPFFTTKPTGEGTGMGLSVVHGIVKSFRGRISVANTRAGGAKFKILIPEAPRELADHRPVTVPLSFSGRGGKILLVDDDTDLLTMGQELLSQLGFQVVAQAAPLAALDQFQRDPWAFDLIVTDLLMPGLTGDRLAWKAKFIRPDIPILLCSGRIDTAQADEIIQRFGIDAFLAKPVGARELAHALTQLLPATPSKDIDHGPCNHH